MNSTTKEEDQEGCRYPQREHRGPKRFCHHYFDIEC